MLKVFQSLNKYKRQEEDVYEQILPDFAIPYFDHLISEFDHLILDVSSDKREKYLYHLNLLQDKRRNQKSLSWNDLYSLELMISNLLPKERLLREVWRLRLRYRDVVGFKQYEAYLAAKPPDLTPEKLNEDDYRADIEYLLTEVYLRYLTTPYNEKLRNRISTKVTFIILAGIAIVVLISFYFNRLHISSLGPASLLLVLFVGAMGGLLSMQQRYQSISRDGDPIDNISVLKQGWSRLFMPAISGAIFAALLYMIIVGDLVKGDLFPIIKLGVDDQNNVLDDIRNSNPESPKDYAKLVVWSFVAGFAERFVPDTLSRFSSTRDLNTIQKV